MATGALRSYSLPSTLISSSSFSCKLGNSLYSSLRAGGFPNFANSRNFHALKQQEAGGGAHRTGHCRLPLPIASIDVKTTSSGKTVAMDSSTIVPAVIVGYGRVGQALEKMGGGHDTVVKRGEPIPADCQGPIIVCTRNDALAAIIDSAPSSRREDFVFIQNGMLEPFLESKGLADATQVLVYFAVAKAGEAPLDGKTDLNPEGLTAASGKWASAIATRLQSAGLSCKVLDPEKFKKQLLEKLIWISAFMLVGARHPGATVGVVEKEHREEVVSLVNELAAAAESEKSIKFDAGVDERLLAYARSVAHFPTAVKEFEWRNGWFYSISQRAIARGQSDPLPLHTAWLKEVGAVKE